jgi:hypothetical protein
MPGGPYHTAESAVSSGGRCGKRVMHALRLSPPSALERTRLGLLGQGTLTVLGCTLTVVVGAGATVGCGAALPEGSTTLLMMGGAL